MGYQPQIIHYTIEERCPHQFYVIDDGYPCLGTGPFTSLRQAEKYLKKKTKENEEYPKIYEYDKNGERI